MLNIKTNPRSFVILAISGLFAGMALYGCSSDKNPPAAQGAAPSSQPAFAFFGPAPHKSGVQLWSETCARCHNSRPPEEFSDSQWETIVHHMRQRANLTGEEAREIVKFLQASN